MNMVCLIRNTKKWVINNDNSKDYTYTIQLDEGFENTKEYLNLK